MPRGSSEIPKGLQKDWRKLAQAMREAGWTFEEGRKHVKAFAPDDSTMTILSGTPGDGAAWRNARADLRRWCRAHEIDPSI